MWAAVILLPPTSRAMSYRSVVLVTTFSCAGATRGASVSRAASRPNAIRRIMYDSREKRSGSERVRLVGAEGESRLHQQAVDQVVAVVIQGLIPGAELGELARIPLEVH